MIARTVMAALSAATLLCVACRPQPAASQENSAASITRAERPTLYLLTSLPLLFPDDMRLDAEAPAVTRALESEFRIVPVDLPSQLPDGATLLAIQPRALPADALVELDDWVRRGGQIVLLADPMLEWPSKRPLGDRLRPPMAYADTGLLTHWGLRLDAPEARGVAYSESDTDPVAMLSPGTLAKIAPGCVVEEGGWMALCAIGKGRATVVADADWLNIEAVRAAGGDPRDNLGWLSRLVTRD